jgi:hypothetical protein
MDLSSGTLSLLLLISYKTDNQGGERCEHVSIEHSPRLGRHPILGVGTNLVNLLVKARQSTRRKHPFILQLLHQLCGPSETAAPIPVVQEVVEALILEELGDVIRRVRLHEGRLPIIGSIRGDREIRSDYSASLFSPRPFFGLQITKLEPAHLLNFNLRACPLARVKRRRPASATLLVGTSTAPVHDQNPVDQSKSNGSKRQEAHQ